MKYIFFPVQYKKALLDKTKNTTIRIKEEIGKYEEGKVYKAKSYAGSDWDISIKVVKVTKTKLRELRKMNVSEKSIKSIVNKGKVSLNSEVELIKFEVFHHN